MTYDDLVGYTGAADADGDVVKFKVSYLRTGTAIISGTTYTTAGAIAGEPVVGPGQTFIWRPASHATGTPQAFDIKLTDTTNVSTALTASVIVSNINDAPTIAYQTPTITGATRYAVGNNPFVISYSMLQTALGAADTESNTITYTITDWLGGQGIGSSTSSTCASGITYYPSAVATSSASTYLCWIPPAGTVGDVTAFRVQVSDSNGAIGGQIATVKINVTGNSLVPSFLTGCFAGGASNGSGCTTTGSFGTTASAFPINKNTSQTFNFSYDYLATLAGVYDTDSSPVSFVITGLSGTIINANATFRKSGSFSNVTTYSSGTPATTALLGPGETMTYSPTSSLATTGSNLLFTFKAWDGAQVSGSAINVNVNLLTVANQNPTFTFAAPIPLSSMTANSWTEITYTQLRQYLDVHDVDDPSRASMKLRVGFFADATNNSTRWNVVKKNGANACGTSPTAIVTGVTSGTAQPGSYIGSGESLCVQILSGGVSAFTTSTTILPVISIRAIDYTSSFADGSDVNAVSGSYIPLMVKQP